MIKFNRVKWKNFLSTGNSFTEIDLNKNKSTLVIGPNGCGKSTMLDAILLVCLENHIEVLINNS